MCVISVGATTFAPARPVKVSCCPETGFCRKGWSDPLLYVKEDRREYLVAPDVPDMLEFIEDGRVELNDVCRELDDLGSAKWCSIETELVYEFEDGDRM